LVLTKTDQSVSYLFIWHALLSIHEYSGDSHIRNMDEQPSQIEARSFENLWTKVSPL